MNELLSKFKELCTTKLTLPSGTEIEVENINIDFQKQLIEKLRDIENNVAVAITYVGFLNNYIYQKTNKDLPYFDKLALLQHWQKIINKDVTTVNITETLIDDTKIDINGINVSLEFSIPCLSKESKLLEFIIQQEEINETDIAFFDNFRFISSIKIQDVTFIPDENPIAELYELYKMFDITAVSTLSNHITNKLSTVNDLRISEIDFSYFLDL